MLDDADEEDGRRRGYEVVEMGDVDESRLLHEAAAEVEKGARIEVRRRRMEGERASSLPDRTAIVPGLGGEVKV